MGVNVVVKDGVQEDVGVGVRLGVKEVVRVGVTEGSTMQLSARTRLLKVSPMYTVPEGLTATP